MLIPENLRADFSSLCGDKLNKIIFSATPVISWGGITDEKNNFQTAYRVKVSVGECLMWDSGEVKTDKPYAKYCGEKLPVGKRIDFSVSIAGGDGIFSEWVSNYFYIGTFDEFPAAKWICTSEDIESVPVYFNKKFSLDREIVDATAFVSGIGCNQIKINGKRIDDTFLNPGVSDYNKTCYYTVIPEIDSYFDFGKNDITITVADGWRRNWGDYLRIYNSSPSFFGTPALWCAVRLTYIDGREEWIYSDESWKWGRGEVVFSHLFDGETYDANCTFYADKDVKLFNEPLGLLKPSTIPPVRVNKIYVPVCIEHIGNNRYIVDFGTNLSGVVRLNLPDKMKKGDKITIRHAQLLRDDGSLNEDNLRGAKCIDTYIASGDEKDLKSWNPEFTYHGFRYAEITGIPLLEKDDVVALMLCTELESTLDFTCGNPTINSIHDMAVHTEQCTCHSAFNDTCGRSERMNWYGDGTVRYGELSYNFDISRMFSHVMELISDTQGEDGSLACTAPFINGKRPADPLSSSYLIVADLLYTHTGNTDIIVKYYDSMCAWENCLLDNSDYYIVNCSYIGDWAGPEYSRDHSTKGGGAGSSLIPNSIMGTAYLMNNARLLRKFALILDRPDDALYYEELFEKTKNAFLDKWYDSKTCKVFNGSQSCQAVALWLDILPDSDKAKAAKIMRDDLVNSGYRFTTGAYCLNFLCFMLIEYGYINEFYELITRDEYPSFGHMIQCGATTCWEKFEYLTGSNMNAHIHPGQICVAQCFYKYIAGVIPVGEGASEFDVRPYFPDKLLTASMTYSTVRGDITVRWRKADGYTNLCVNIPFNIKANIYTPDGVKTVGSGFHSFNW